MRSQRSQRASSVNSLHLVGSTAQLPEDNRICIWLEDLCSERSVPKCDLCWRPLFIFGRRDSVTGWERWCQLCNWRWRYHSVKTLTEFRVFDSMHIYHEIRWRIVEFLMGSEWTHFWKTGAAQCTLRKIQTETVLTVWKRLLLGDENMLVQDELTGQLYVPGHADELQDGALDPHLNYRNKFWKLQLAGNRMGALSDPLRIVIEMLGCPP